MAPFCVISRVVCGYARGTETGCSYSKPIDVWGASWQCDRLLRCLPGSDDLAGGFGGGVSVHGARFEHCPGPSCAAAAVDYYRGFLHLAAQIPLLARRMVVVFGSPRPNDWSGSSRNPGPSRSIHLPCPDWTLRSPDLERTGVVEQTPLRPRGINRPCSVNNNRTNGGELRPNVVLAE